MNRINFTLLFVVLLTVFSFAAIERNSYGSMFLYPYGQPTANGITVSQNGNVGIGTTTTPYKLSVSGDIVLMDPVNNRMIVNRVANNSGAYPLSIEATNNDLWFGVGAGTPTERVRITTGGNVGIGTTAPSTRLEVAGTVSASALVVNGDSYFRTMHIYNQDPIQFANGQTI